jgi:hypothetical protein
VRKTGGSHRKGVVTPGERESSREAVVGSSWHGMAWLRTWCGRKRSGGDDGGVAMGWERQNLEHQEKEERRGSGGEKPGNTVRPVTR